MTRIGLVAAAVLFMNASLVLADTSIEQVQRALKDQGFYYGEVTGQVDTDTTAAIRRFQIRNGLKVTGELDAETRKSLGVAAAASTPKPATQQSAAPQPTSTPETPDLRDESTPQPQVQRRLYPEPPPDYSPAPPNEEPGTTSLFAGTPFEVAPPEIQQRVVARAQIVLARGGYYRSGSDGMYGPGTAAALRAYQSQVGLAPTGRLDIDTLGALGLLPEQNRPGFPPRRRFFRPPSVEFTPDGEPIYVPR